AGATRPIGPGVLGTWPPTVPARPVAHAMPAAVESARRGPCRPTREPDGRGDRPISRMDHDEWLELISAAADGELDAAESARLAEHLDRCPSCTRLLADFEATRRRARLRTGTQGDHLVASVLDARGRDHADADRARAVLLRRCTAAAVSL